MLQTASYPPSVLGDLMGLWLEGFGLTGVRFGDWGLRALAVLFSVCSRLARYVFGLGVRDVVV